MVPAFTPAVRVSFAYEVRRPSAETELSQLTLHPRFLFVGAFDGAFEIREKGSAADMESDAVW